jgi:hypothetical protein
VLLRFAAKIVNAFRDAPMSRQGVPSTSFTSSAPDGDPLDLTVGANYGVPEVDWGALKADMILAANKLGDHLSVLKVRAANMLSKRNYLKVSPIKRRVLNESAFLGSRVPKPEPEASPAVWPAPHTPSDERHLTPTMTLFPKHPQIMDSTSPKWPGVEAGVQVRRGHLFNSTSPRRETAPDAPRNLPRALPCDSTRSCPTADSRRARAASSASRATSTTRIQSRTHVARLGPPSGRIDCTDTE